MIVRGDLLAAGRLLRPFFIDEHQLRKRVWAATTVLALLSVANTSLQVLITYLQRDFSTALATRETAAFHACLWKFVGVLAFACPFMAFAGWAQMAFVLWWREWMTTHLALKYFDGVAYFTIAAKAGIDNPDERITDDVRTFTANVVLQDPRALHARAHMRACMRARLISPSAFSRRSSTC